MKTRGIIAFVAVLMMAMSARAQVPSTQATPRTVTVSGEGLVRTIPDQATVRFGVVSQAEDPEEARRINAEASRDAMNAVRALGVEERRIRLEGLRLQPAREYDPTTQQMKEVGFEASRQIVVEVYDLETLPTLVAQVVQQGANRLDGVAYDLKNRDASRDEALVNALNNARDKARLMASTVGEELGPVVSIHEQSFNFPRPVLRLAEANQGMTKATAPEPEAYAAGEIEVRVVVQVVFLLK